MAERMRIDDALKFFPKINPLFFLANRTAWKGEITGPDFVCKHSAARRIREGVGTKSVGGDGSGGVWRILSINHHCDKALQ